MGRKSKNKLKKLPTVTINAVENPISCIIKIGKQRLRPHLDVGAAMSFVISDVYRSLHDQFKLSKPKVYLKSVNGADLKTVDCTNIESKIDDLSHSLMNFMLLKRLTWHSYWGEIS